ncbi:MAG: FHA domain-containing protein [Scytolyngbya sp. HA4215-MV1]|jgi:pSer/pThr/pTyr-binding forkhead associated (FHA) protein|nr:FHA domain-containing protein [Scytolyngbya sp. HA4215-MV1]
MPAEPKPVPLLLISDTKGNREFLLDKELYIIGRDSKCDIRLVSPFVSRHHATLVRFQEANGASYYRIVDGDLRGQPSTNGILINGRKLTSHKLKNEDEIVFAPNVMIVYYGLERGDEMECKKLVAS